MNIGLEDVRAFADILLLPILGMVWGVQGRISKLEGKIEALQQTLSLLIGVKNK